MHATAAAVECLRHDRASAAARAVAGPAVDAEFDWSSTNGYVVSQETDRGGTWTWAPHGLKERRIHLWTGRSEETVVHVRDQAAAGRVVEAYLRALVGDGPRLRINVLYAGPYDTELSYDENVVRHEPVTDVIRRPSLVPGAPVTDDDPTTFHTDPPIVETVPMPVDSDVLHRSAVLAAGRLVHGLVFQPRYGEKHLIRRADSPAHRTVLATPHDVADVWSPESGPVLVRLSTRDGERSTTLVASSRDDGLAMATAYLHASRRDGGTGDLTVEATIYGRYDPSVDPATNRLAARKIVMSLPRPRARTSVAPVAPVRPAAAAAPVRQSESETQELLRSYGVSSLADLPHGAAKLIATPKPKREFA